MEEPDWAKVLQLIYDRGGRVAFITSGTVPNDYSVPSSDFVPEDKKLIPNPYFDKEKTLRNFQTLKRVGLVEEITEEDIREGYQNPRVEHPMVDVYELTNEGFNVAHERELRKQQQALMQSQNDAIESQTAANDTLANFTIILGVTALVQALAAVVSAPRYSEALALFYLILLLAMWRKSSEWFHTG